MYLHAVSSVDGDESDWTMRTPRETCAVGVNRRCKLVEPRPWGGNLGGCCYRAERTNEVGFCLTFGERPACRVAGWLDQNDKPEPPPEGICSHSAALSARGHAMRMPTTAWEQVGRNSRPAVDQNSLCTCGASKMPQAGSRQLDLCCCIGLGVWRALRQSCPLRQLQPADLTSTAQLARV